MFANDSKRKHASRGISVAMAPWGNFFHHTLLMISFKFSANILCIFHPLAPRLVVWRYLFLKLVLNENNLRKENMVNNRKQTCFLWILLLIWKHKWKKKVSATIMTLLDCNPASCRIQQPVFSFKIHTMISALFNDRLSMIK